MMEIMNQCLILRMITMKKMRTLTAIMIGHLRVLQLKVLVRTQKYLQVRFGGIEDEELDDADEEEQEWVVWGLKKEMYGADVDNEILGEMAVDNVDDSFT